MSTDAEIEPGVVPFAPLSVSQFVPVMTVELAENEAPTPVLVVIGSVCGTNELPAAPANSSVVTEDITSTRDQTPQQFWRLCAGVERFVRHEAQDLLGRLSLS